MTDRAQADLEQIQALVDGGMTRKEAAAQFTTEESFQSWLEAVSYTHLFLAFPMMGVNILASSYLASLSKGGPAFVLSVLRGAAAVIPAVLLLSRLFGITGVWLAVPCAEALTFLVFLAMLPF